MKLVEFENGKYGVRVGWLFGYKFVDLQHPNYSWAIGARFFNCCMGTKEEAKKAMQNRGVKYKICD